MSISLWTARTAAANNNWSSVAYGNGLFVAVSNSGNDRLIGLLKLLLLIINGKVLLMVPLTV
jgi:hypothetical protein